MHHFRDNLGITKRAGTPSDLGVGAQLDAGNRLRVSQITTLIDVKQTNDDAPLYFSRANGGAGTQTYEINRGGTVMDVVADGDYAVCQTKMWAPYYSGKGQFGEITFSDMNPQANVIKRAGYFSSATTGDFSTSYDGFWVETQDTTTRFVISKTGTVKMSVDQSEWNIDKAEWLDMRKFNVFVFQFLYLGGTAVKFGFIHEGVIRWCHVYVHAGLVEDTFIRTPQQPVRYEIRSTGGTGNFLQICAQIASEGSIDEIGVQRSYTLNGLAVNANSVGTFYALMGLRLKQAYRNIRVEEQSVNILATTNDDFLWELRINPTVAGTFTYNDQANSALQLALGDTVANPSPNSVTGGLIIQSGLGSGNSGVSGVLRSSLRLGSTIAGVPDALVICISPLTTNLDITGSVNIKEFL